MVIFRQILRQIRKFFTHNVDNFAVLEEPSDDEETLVGGVFELRSGNVGASHIANIYPKGRAGGEEFGFFELAIGYVADALVGCIEVLVEISEVRVHWSEDEGGVDLSDRRGGEMLVPKNQHKKSEMGEQSLP